MSGVTRKNLHLFKILRPAAHELNLHIPNTHSWVAFVGLSSTLGPLLFSRTANSLIEVNDWDGVYLGQTDKLWRCRTVSNKYGDILNTNIALKNFLYCFSKKATEEIKACLLVHRL